LYCITVVLLLLLTDWLIALLLNCYVFVGDLLIIVTT